MGKSMFPSDTITFKVSTGGNSAGNGGDGYNKGDISNSPSIKFDPSNKAEGADVHVKNGDDVSQKAYWDAGGANAKAEGGAAKSKGMELHGGHKKSDAKAEMIPRQRAELPNRMATRTQTAAITNPTWKPTRPPIRRTGSLWSRAKKCTPALAAKAETRTMRKAGMLTSRRVSRPPT